MTGPFKCSSQRGAWLLQAAGLFTIAWVPRLLHLGAFITWDELAWVHRSLQFGRAVLSGNWAATLRTGHPGVVTTWLGALGIGAQRLLLGVPSATEWAWLLQLPTLDPRDAAALNRLAPLLVAAKIPLTVVAALGVVGCWALGRHLVGGRTALLGGLLLALDPFFLGLSRVLHLDALLSTFMAVGLLSLLVYLRSSYQHRWLVLSALATGLAALTKAPALFLLPLGAVLLLASTGRPARDPLVWCGLIAATYIALLPAMWAAPAEALSAVLDKALGYAAEAEETAHFFRGSAVSDPGPLFYPFVFLFRVSPLVLVGLLASPLVWRSRSDGRRRWVWGILLTYVLLYGLAIAHGAKKFDRYLLPLFPAMDLLAAVGWGCVGEAITRQWPKLTFKQWPVICGGTLVLIQAFLVLPCHPYYLAWYNPLLGGLHEAVRTLPVGWGEGLEQAAAYLNAQPHAEKLTVASAGVPGMAPKFRGQTLPLTPASLIEADYVVVYVSDRQGGPSPVDKFVAGTLPQHVVHLQGVEYAWVYPNESYRVPLQLLASEAEVGDALLIDAPSMLAQHYDGPLPHEVLRGDESQAELASVLQRLAAGRERIWHVRFPALPSLAAETAHYELASRAYRLGEEVLPLATLLLYELPDEVTFAPDRLRSGAGPFTFGGQLRLVRYGLADASIGWGQRLGLRIVWKPVLRPDADYTSFLHLVDEGSHLWGQIDLPLRNERGEGIKEWSLQVEQTMRYLLEPWAGIPPGSYQLVAGVYRSDSQERLSVVDGQGQPLGNVLTIGQVQVTSSPLQPTMEDLAIACPLLRDIGGSITLLGYGLWPSSIQPGSLLHLDLWWRVEFPPREDYELSVKLGDEEKRFALPHRFHPSSQWQSGEMLRGQFDLGVPAHLPDGEYAVHINLLRADGSPLLAEPILLQEVRVESRARSFEVPDISHPLNLRLGDRIALLGYDVREPSVKPGEVLTLILYWQSHGPTEVAYTVFTHLLDPQGRVLAQKDTPPRGGAAPTTGWLPGEVISDEYRIPIPWELPPGPLGIEVGMYDPATGERLPMYDKSGNRLAGDRALLMPLERE